LRLRDAGTRSNLHVLPTERESRMQWMLRRIRSTPTVVGPFTALAFSAVFAALVAFILGRGPQPFTDVAAVHFSAIEDDVLLVAMDGAKAGEWTRLTATAHDHGARAVGSVSPPEQVTGLHTDPERRLDRQLGMVADLDGKVRTWKASADTFGVRLMYRGGQLVPRGQRSLPLARDGVPVLNHAHVDYVSGSVFHGRTILFANLESWQVPMVTTPAGDIPAAEAVARAVAGPPKAVPNSLLVLAAGGLLGFLGALSIHTRRARTAWLGVAASLALVVGCSMLSITMPIEVPIGAVATGTFVSLALVISVHREGFKALVDRALWHLRTAGERPSAKAAWEEVAVASVDLNVARRAWVLAQDADRDWRTLAAADEDGVVTLMHDRPPQPFAHPLTMQLRSADGQVSTLLLEPKPFVDPDSMVALKELIAHTAQTRGDARLDDERSYFVTGVSILHACLDAMLRRGAFVQDVSEDSVAARALFDPLGRLVSCDPRVEALLFPYGRSLEARLIDVWTDLGGARSDVTRVLTGRGARTLSTVAGDLVVMRAARHGKRLVGVVVEAVQPEGGILVAPRGVLDQAG